MNRAQESSHKQALKLIDLYERGLTSKEVAAEMGWHTKFPKQMVNNYINRFRARGYRIGARGSKQ